MRRVARVRVGGKLVGIPCVILVTDTIGNSLATVHRAAPNRLYRRMAGRELD